MHFNDRIQIGEDLISKESPVFLIGEAGVNHNGSVATAKQLVDCACAAGVNAVKFQMFQPEQLILQHIEKAPYQKKATGAGGSQFDLLKQLAMGEQAFVELMAYCKEKGLIFLCTPFEKDSLDKLDSLDIPAYKVAATDITNLQFLRQIAQKGRPVILSAGMCYLDEIRLALREIYPINRDVILLQCTANYPAADAEVNLNVIDTLQQEFDIIVGYSDHSQGIGAAPYAVAKGAKVVEKHFTIDREMDGPDHRASVEPDDLRWLVQEVRRVEKYLGSGIKVPSFSEQLTRRSLQKCFVALCDISVGEQFSDVNVVAKRTGGKGISALYYKELLDRVADRVYRKDDIIEW